MPHVHVQRGDTTIVMASLLPKSAFGVPCIGSAPRGTIAPAACKLVGATRRRAAAASSVNGRPQRQRTVQCQAFFSFFTPKPAAAAVDPRVEEVVEEVIALCQGTDAGLKASPQKKEAIAAAVRKSHVRLGLGACTTNLCASPVFVPPPPGVGGGGCARIKCTSRMHVVANVELLVSGGCRALHAQPSPWLPVHPPGTSGVIRPGAPPA